jgi:hypothetical protein
VCEHVFDPVTNGHVDDTGHLAIAVEAEQHPLLAEVAASDALAPFT